MTFTKGTISELTTYLIDRYFSQEKIKDELLVSSVRRWLIRNLEDKKRLGFNLYEQLEKNEQGVKCISITDFEHYLFDKWCSYVKSKHSGKYDSNLIEDDFERIIGHDDDDAYWIVKAEQVRLANNSYLENANEQESDNDPNTVTDKELMLKGINLMIQGIFEATYGPFDWMRLERDIYQSRWFDGQHLDEVTPELLSSVKAAERTKNFRNYISTKGGNRNE